MVSQQFISNNSMVEEAACVSVTSNPVLNNDGSLDNVEMYTIIILGSL